MRRSWELRSLVLWLCFACCGVGTWGCAHPRNAIAHPGSCAWPRGSCLGAVRGGVALWFGVMEAKASCHSLTCEASVVCEAAQRPRRTLTTLSTSRSSPRRLRRVLASAIHLVFCA